MVLSSEGRYQGKLDMADLLTSDPDLQVAEVMKLEADTVLANVPVTEVAALFERRDLISVVVSDDEDRLLGRITIDDAVPVIHEEADRLLLQSAGLEEEPDLFAPILPSARRRGFWLGINLAKVFVAAWVIGLFEEALDKIVALAVLMPVVASMGGIAVSQTLTLTIRGLALNQIAASNVRWLISSANGFDLLWAMEWTCTTKGWASAFGTRQAVAMASP